MPPSGMKLLPEPMPAGTPVAGRRSTLSENIQSRDEIPKVLVADDDARTLRLLVEILSNSGYNPRPVADGPSALRSAMEEPPDLILLDVDMPGCNGFEVCESLKADQRLRDIPVIFLSGLHETLDKLKSFSVGGVDYLTKPFQGAELRARINTHLKLGRLQRELERYNRELEMRVLAQVQEISESQMATIFALAKLAESRHHDTGKHIERTRTFCRLLALRLADTRRFRSLIDDVFIDNIHHASPLHDIGKVGISDSTLLKPGRYTPEEFAEMKTHTLIGAQTLEAVRSRYPHNSFLSMGIEIARSHHEKWDGSGYPEGRAGAMIPLSARIMALADVYDALRSRRSYKPGYSHEASREIILADSGKHFDPEVVEAFSDLESQFEEIRDQMEDRPVHPA
jgi:putative two-component system response regulator